MQDKQELKVSHCFWSFSFLSPCCCKLLIATAAKKPKSGQTLRWLKIAGPVLREVDRDGPAPVKEASFHWGVCVSALLVWSQNALAPQDKAVKFADSWRVRPEGSSRNHLLWPVMGLTEAKWKPPVPSRVFKWLHMTSAGKHTSIYHHC